MTNKEAIARIKDHMVIHNINEPRATFISEALYMAIEALENQKTGRWIGHGEHCRDLGVMPSGLGAYEWCSNCDCGIDVREWHRNPYNYCPNCGAKMRENKQ